MTDIVERLRQERASGLSASIGDTEDAITEITRLRAENARIGKELNIARYGNPDFAWSLHQAQMNDLRTENERLREAHKEWCAARGALFANNTQEGWTRLANAEHALYALKGESDE